MTDERRYRDDEVRRIFGTASEAQEPLHDRPPSQGGLTLTDLQEIGREVGISPERIAHAALELDRFPAAPTKTGFLGVPFAVNGSVDLPRPLTSDQWNVLVTEVRQTFGANGRVREEGGSKVWANGNLHIVVEPTSAGHRLRMGTRKSSAVPSAAVGAFAIVCGTLLLPAGMSFLALGFISGGAASLLSTALRLPRWARTRQLQMEHIGERALSLTAPSLSDAGDR